MNKTLFFSLILLAISIGFTSPAFSQTPTPTSCPPLYNGGIVCQEANDFSIDKKIQTPKDGSFVDRINQGDARITPERTMIFRIVTTNKTEKTLRNIRVIDTLPAFVQYITADTAVKKGNTIVSYTISSLEAKQTHTVNLETKVLSNEKLPGTNGPLCVANEVEAKSGFTSVARDFVTFCIEREGTQTSQATEAKDPSSFAGLTKGGTLISPTPVNTTKGGQTVHPAPVTSKNPDTGPEVLALIGLIPGAIAGFWLRKKA
jgi:uncharacterized repeat protein (TIGR01451 family)